MPPVSGAILAPTLDYLRRARAEPVFARTPSRLGRIPVAPCLGEEYPLYLRDQAGCRSSDMIPGGVAGLQLTIEEAIGGVTDYPALVTPDYRRVLRIDLDRWVTLQTDGSATCGVPAAMTFSLRLVQTAADFAVTSQLCYVCK